MTQQKLWELAKQVSEFLVWRQVVCPFDRDRRILQYLVTTPVFNEDGQYLIFCIHVTVRCCLEKLIKTRFAFLRQSCIWPHMRVKGLRTTWRRTAVGPSGGCRQMYTHSESKTGKTVVEDLILKEKN